MCFNGMHHGYPGCDCQGEVPLRGLLHIAALTLIKDKPAHGGEIYQSLKNRFGIDAPRAIIYALLRRAEENGFIISSWDIPESGPARRMYRITEEGLDYLKSTLERLKKAAELIQALVGEKA